VRQSGNIQEAEDLLQETFLQAYFALGRYTPERRATLAVHPWLYKIALNIFYGRLRKNRLQFVLLDFAEDGPHLSLTDDEQNQPEVLLEKQEDLSELGALLSRLPEHFRIVINLFYFVGLSYQEIADLLNISPGTVRSHMIRGIRKLRKILAQTPERRQGKHVV
jgi:RNA polymerase sigma-70 factor (ECF subfamily)